MINDVLNAVETAIKTIPEIRYISEDWGQLDYYAQPPVLWPCALLECEGVDYSTLGNKIQRGTGTITIRFADFRNLQTPNVRTADSATDRYGIFAQLTEAHKVIQGLSGQTFSPLDRRSIRRTRRDDAIREFVLTYAFSFTDYSASKKAITHPAPPAIGVKKATP